MARNAHAKPTVRARAAGSWLGDKFRANKHAVRYALPNTKKGNWLTDLLFRTRLSSRRRKPEHDRTFKRVQLFSSAIGREEESLREMD